MTDRDDTQQDDAALEAYFSAARRATPALDAAFMARLHAQAQAEQTRRADAGRARPGLWAQLGEALGGWAGMGGLVAASAAGLVVGLWPMPGALDPVSVLQAIGDPYYHVYGPDTLLSAMEEDGG
jgi:predicted lipid-binding transport protein (Tim44 family)